jgi:hypothetical protein
MSTTIIDPVDYGLVCIGIDPGKKGGLSLVSSLIGVIDSIEMPILKGELDLSYITCLLIKWIDKYGVSFIVTEAQQAMGGQGVTSTFTTGYNYGLLLGVASTIGTPIIKVRPKEWQAIIKDDLVIMQELIDHTMKMTKKKSLSACNNLYPLIPLVTARGRWMDGISDSILIATYGCLKIKVIKVI